MAERGRPRKKVTNFASAKLREEAEAQVKVLAEKAATKAAARAKRAEDDRRRDRRDEENRRAANERVAGVGSLSLLGLGLVVGKRKRTNTGFELDEEGRRKLHVLWVHRGERLFRQYTDRKRRLRAAKSKAEYRRVSGETLPDRVLPDWSFNEFAADALHLAARVVKVHWKAWQSARVKLVGERLRVQFGGKAPVKVLWFFPVAKIKE